MNSECLILSNKGHLFVREAAGKKETKMLSFSFLPTGLEAAEVQISGFSIKLTPVKHTHVHTQITFGTVHMRHTGHSIKMWSVGQLLFPIGKGQVSLSSGGGGGGGSMT